MLNKFLGWFFNCTKLSLSSKFTLNSRFKKSLLKEKKYINLSQYKNYYISIEESSFNSKTAYNLIFNGVDLNSNKESVVVAIFDSMDKAEDALLLVNNKLYGIFGSVIKGFLVFLLFSFFINLFVLMLGGNSTNNFNNKQMSSVQLEKELEKSGYAKQIQELKQMEDLLKQLPVPEGRGTPPQQQSTNSEPITEEVKTNSQIGSFLLGK